MKLFLLACLVALAVAAPQNREKVVKYDTDKVSILDIENDSDGEGNYKSRFSLSDGTQQEMEGRVINPGQKDETIIMRGSYIWVGPDGVTYTVTYIADDNGFQPKLEQGPGGAIPAAVRAAFNGVPQ